MKNSVFYIVCIFYILTVVLIWANEFMDVPGNYLGAEKSPARLEEALVETVQVSILFVLGVLVIARLEKRIVELEQFVVVCAWCKKVRYKDRWMPFEEFLQMVGDVTTSHGMCAACEAKLMEKESSRKVEVGV